MNSELDEVIFNEIISDLVSLIKEHGPSAVAQSISYSFPEEAAALHHYLGKDSKQVARLFQP